MSSSSELLLLRLGLLGIVFTFVLVAAAILRSGLRPRAAVARPAAGAAPGYARFVLIVPSQTGIPPGAVFQLAGEMTVGRDAGNGIVLADASVSGRHAVVRQARRGWQVADAGSTNGTLVNGRAIDGRGAGIKDGDRVTFGTVVLQFQA